MKRALSPSTPAVLAPLFSRTRFQATSRKAGSQTRLQRSSNRRSSFSPAHRCSLVSNLQYPGFCLFEAGSRCARIHKRPSGVTATALRTCCLPSPCGRLSLPRTTMQAPPPPAPSADDGPARQLAVGGRRRRVPTFTLLPIDRLGARLCPCGLATPTPQIFGVASLPATSRPARKFPALAGARRSPAHIRQVGAGGVT